MASRTSETADKRKHKMPHAPFEFLDIPYTPGSTLKAVGYKEEGRIIASQEVTTAGEPAQIQLVADYEGVDFVADGSDLIRVYVYVLDQDGNLCPETGNKIQFHTSVYASVGGEEKRVGSNPVNAEAGITTVPCRRFEYGRCTANSRDCIEHAQ